MAVEDYIASSALVEGAGEGRRVRVERGQLTRELLSDQGARTPGTPLSLEHVGAPLDRSAYRAWKKRPDRAAFVASSRFAAVGLAARMVDALMRLTLLLRGRVPGGFAAAAHHQVRPMRHPARDRVTTAPVPGGPQRGGAQRGRLRQCHD